MMSNSEDIDSLNANSSPVETRGGVNPDFETSLSALAPEFHFHGVSQPSPIDSVDQSTNTEENTGSVVIDPRAHCTSDKVCMDSEMDLEEVKRRGRCDEGRYSSEKKILEAVVPSYGENEETHVIIDRNNQFVVEDSPISSVGEGSSRNLCLKSNEITRQIASGKYECICCLDVIGHRSAVWSCQHCHRLLHLHCIKKWANTIESGTGKNFRCPHCQMETTDEFETVTPQIVYRCYCKKMTDPKYDPSIVPHSCGDVCGKKRGMHNIVSKGSRTHNCPHPCEALCHPGPCPPCGHTVVAECPCGATSFSYKCDGVEPIRTCGGICNKPMSNCGLLEMKQKVSILPSGVLKQDQMTHTCSRTCHTGPCDPCDNILAFPCVCGKEIREVICGSLGLGLGEFHTSSSRTMNETKHNKGMSDTNSLIFRCNQRCGKLQQCGIHKCPVKCHSGVCPPCDTDTRVITTCPCGKTELTYTRTNCQDPIPVCGQKCGKALLCGNHFCEEDCHLDHCPPCNKKSYCSCQCGNLRMKIPCSDRGSLRCEKICKTQLNCGRHECKEICCPGRNKGQHLVHNCQGYCKKRLPCGHFCPESCHSGSCPPCLNIITDFLRCACGAEVMEPPLPCGTQLPRCFRQCLVEPSCKHPSVPHTCHVGPCPPCPYLVDKMCAGDHQIVKSIRCGSKTITCGKECGKLLQCGHFCLRPCHTDPCLRKPVTGNRDELVMSCSHTCDKVIPECGHFCSKRCHPNDKDSISCKCTSFVEIKCPCGQNKKKIPCNKYQLLLKESLKITTDNNNSKEGDCNTSRDLQFPALECNDDCIYHNRLSVLSNGLHDSKTGLKGPEKLKKTIYSIEAWNIAQYNIDQVKSVEGHLNRFALGSLQNTRSIDVTVLPSMSSNKRKIVHVLCLYYRIKCESYDTEPNRSCHLNRTHQTRIPTPLLSEAVLTTRGDSNTIKFLRNTLGYCREVSVRVLALIGSNLSERTINEVYLKSFVGSFVVVRSTDAEELVRNLAIPSSDNQPLIASNLRSLVDEDVFFVSFLTSEDLEGCLSFLRKTSNNFKYQRVDASEESLGVEPVPWGSTAVANVFPTTRSTTYAVVDPTVSWAGRMQASRVKYESTKPDLPSLSGKFGGLRRK